MSGAIKNGAGRAPCCGWSGAAAEHLGGLFQHYRASEASVAVYPNITTVADYMYVSPGAPGPNVAPYARQNPSILVDAGDCAPDGLTCGAAGTGVMGCGPQTVVNTFGAVTRVNLAVCMKFGHKRIQAGRNWQGRLGFTDLCGDSQNPPLSGTPGSQKFGRADWTWFQKTPDLDEREGEYLESSGSGWIEVDPLTGMVTGGDITVVFREAQFDVSGNFLEYTFPGGSADTANISSMWNGCMPLFYQDFLDANTAAASGDDTAPFVAYQLSRTISNDQHIIKVAQMIYTDFDEDGNRIGPGTPTPGGLAPTFGSYFEGSILLSNAIDRSDVVKDLYSLSALWSLNDDVLYPWRHDGFTVRAPYVDRNEGHGTLNLIFTPSVNDYRQPTMGSGTAGDPYTAWQQMGWFDSSSYQWVFPNGGDQTNSVATALVAKYDGAIRGAPIRPGGAATVPDKYWDGTHPNDVICTPSEEGQTPFFYTYSFGRWNVDDGMPAAATQWTRLSDEGGDLNPNAPIGQGHWLRMLPGGSIRMQKEAVIFQPTPSQNYFGPSGPARFGFNTGTVRCIASISAGIVTLADGLHLTVGADDLFRVANSSDVTNGIYKVTRTDDTHYHLDTLVYDLTGYVDPLDVGGTEAAKSVTVTGQFGLVRWPKALPIQGRAMITSATQNGSNVDLVIEAAPYLRTGDKIDITGVPGLGANCIVTVTDPTHITVAGTMVSLQPSAFIISTGAPDWTWYDTRVKGDYVLLRWTWDYRDYLVDPTLRPNQASWGLDQGVKVFLAEDHCLCWKPCCPMVICASPNGETFTNGITHAFPDAGAVALDDTKGYLWQGAIQTGMGDIYWQADPEPCVANNNLHLAPTCINWSVDPICATNDPGGGCLDGTKGTFYFPIQPIVEARNTLPAGAPALQPGIFVGFVDQATMNTAPPGSDAHGAVALPPTAGGGQDGLWVTWQHLRNCAVGGGQFGAIYAQQIIVG